MITTTIAMAAMAVLFVLYGLLGNAEEGCGGQCGGCIGACENDTEGRSE